MTLVNQHQQRARNMALLPPHCFAIHPGTGEVVFIQRGHTGYTATVGLTQADVELSNISLAPEQVKAMLAGSMFGFHTEAANPLHYKQESTNV
jgi:hypothetical protein